MNLAERYNKEYASELVIFDKTFFGDEMILITSQNTCDMIVEIGHYMLIEGPHYLVKRGNGITLIRLIIGRVPGDCVRVVGKCPRNEIEWD